MKIIRPVFLALLVLSFAACSGRGNQPPIPVAEPGSGIISQAGIDSHPEPEPQNTYVRHIVVLNDGESKQTRDNIAGGLDISATHFYNTVFIGFAGEMSATEVENMQNNSRVMIVEEDQEVFLSGLTNNPDDDPWGIVADLVPTTSVDLAEGPIRFEGDNPADWGVLRINAFPSPGLQGAGVTVAVIDSGFDETHTDFGAAIVATFNAAEPGEPMDWGYHGTMVAGFIAARDNDQDIVGVAPLASLALVKITKMIIDDDDNPAAEYKLSYVLNGIDWVAENQTVVSPEIKVVNMSLAYYGTSEAMALAITNATNQGLVFVVAAGNDSRDASYRSPASYENVICVSGLKRTRSFPWNPWIDGFYNDSNYGNVIDIIAPGADVLSLKSGGGTRRRSGTSYASPHVAGAAALWLDENSVPNNETAFEQVKNALLSTGESGTWIGDPDGIYEPLVDVSTF